MSHVGLRWTKGAVIRGVGKNGYADEACPGLQHDVLQSIATR